MVEKGGGIVVRWREPRHYAGPVSPFSKGGIALGLVMALFFVFAASWNMAAYTFWSILAYGLTFTLLLMGIAVRAWLLLGVDVWVWVPFVASAYILAWLVPALRCTPNFGHFSGTGFVMPRPQALGLDVPLRCLIANR